MAARHPRTGPPDALFRTGEALLALDLRSDARATFREVRKRFPHTTAAVEARDRLEGLGRRYTRAPGSGRPARVR